MKRLGLAILLAALGIPMLAQAQEVAHFALKVENKRIDIGSNLTYDAWTYDGTVPGPVLRVHQGDLVDVRLENEGDVAHGIDIHAAQLPPRNFHPIGQHGSNGYRFRAEVPGVFMYHCSAPPVVTHIANGMYGMMIVDPKKDLPKAHEVMLVQGEFYGEPDANGFIAGNGTRMMEEKPDFVVFNGAIEKYMEKGIAIKVGELVRVYFVNAGPNQTATFHIMGTILSTVYRGGNPANVEHGLQSFEVGPGDGAVFEFTVKQPGDYMFVDHAIARAYKGAIGMFRATLDGTASGG